MTTLRALRFSFAFLLLVHSLSYMSDIVEIKKCFSFCRLLEMCYMELSVIGFGHKAHSLLSSSAYHADSSTVRNDEVMNYAE